LVIDRRSLDRDVGLTNVVRDLAEKLRQPVDREHRPSLGLALADGRALFAGRLCGLEQEHDGAGGLVLRLRARDALEAVTGQRPVGHRAAQWDLSPHPIELVAELGFAYDSSMMADDECYELVTRGTPTGVVEIPVEWVRDDAVYLLFNRDPARTPPRGQL
jgi:hypothetical protein